MASIWLEVYDPQKKLQLADKEKIKTKLEGKTITVRLDDPDLTADDKIVNKDKLEPLIRKELLKAAAELDQATQLRLTKVDSVVELGKVLLTVDTNDVPPYRCNIEVAGPVNSDPENRHGSMKRGTPPKPPPMGGPKKSLVKPEAKPEDKAEAEPQPKTIFVKNYQEIVKRHKVNAKPSVISALNKLDANRDGNKTGGLCTAALKVLKDTHTKDTEALKQEKDNEEKLRISKWLFDLRKLLQSLERFSKAYT
jgi:hypothetical protein